MRARTLRTAESVAAAGLLMLVLGTPTVAPAQPAAGWHRLGDAAQAFGGRSAATRMARPRRDRAALDRLIGETAEEGRRKGAREEARRETQAGKDERRASKQRFGNLSRADAVGVATATFAIGRPAWEPPALQTGDRLVGYLGDNAMLIDRSGPAGRAIIESTLPLWATNDRGVAERVSVELRDRGSAFAPENALLPSRIAKKAMDGFSLPTLGTVVRPGNAERAEAAQVVGDRVVFANMAADTDWIVSPLPRGVEASWQLRSANSPTELALDFGLSGDQRLALLANSAGAASIQRRDTRVATISAPIAVDAQGRSVPAAFVLDGSRLTVRVAHDKGDYAYPILVDPAIVDSDPNPYTGGWGWDATDLSGFNWAWQFPGLADAQYQYTYDQYSYPSNSYSFWFYQPWRESYLYKFAFGGYSARLAPNACAITGLTDSTISQWLGGPNSAGGTGYAEACAGPSSRNDLVAGDTWPGSGWHCAQASCAVSGTGIVGDLALVVLTYHSAQIAQGASSTAMLSPSVYISDDNAPQLYTYPRGPAGWTTDNSIAGPVRAGDVGLGVKWVRATLNGSTTEVFGTGCAGTAGDPCPDDSGGTISWTLPEGLNSITYSADDALGGAGHTDVSYEYKPVDRTPPTVTLAGPLWDRRDRIVGDPSKLTVYARDGLSGDDPLLERSGVKRVQIERKQGNVASTNAYLTVKDVSQPCQQSSCPMTVGDWELDPSTLTPGTYTIRVTAWDQLDQASTPQVFEVVAGGGRITSIKDGLKTSRRITLAAQRFAGDTSTEIEFQFRRGTGSWSSIPVATLSQGRQQPVTAWPLALDAGGKSPTLVWDVASTAGVAFTDGDVQVRGVLTGPGGTRMTQDVVVKLDQRGLGQDHATSAVGPGAVDLLTGNYAVSATDVSISAPLGDLTVTRTFNSRDPASSPSGPLGPGWVLSTPLTDAGLDFVSLRDTAEQTASGVPTNTVVVTRGDGSEIVFTKAYTAGGTAVYSPQNAASDLSLTAVMSSIDPSKVERFEIADIKGDVVVFGPGTGAGNYLVTRIDQPGASVQTTYSFEPTGGTPAGKRPTRVLAAVPSSVAGCTPTMVAGCRALDFLYAAENTTTSGEYPGRLIAIKLNAPPARPIEVARYSYDSSGLLTAAWDPRINPPLQAGYAYDTGGRLAQITPPGELPWTVQYQALASGDSGAGRLRSVSRPTVSGMSIGADAQTTGVCPMFCVRSG